ncbi:MAG: hypothetical protein IKF39_04230 [Oscillospiraceae bacterium]|nr:hypothetical protein [Oscillospiraceae bacterium]
MKIIDDVIGVITHDALMHYPGGGESEAYYYIRPGFMSDDYDDAMYYAETENKPMYLVRALFYVNPDEGITYDDQLSQIYEEAIGEIYDHKEKREIEIEDDLPDFSTLKPWD